MGKFKLFAKHEGVDNNNKVSKDSKSIELSDSDVENVDQIVHELVALIDEIPGMENANIASEISFIVSQLAIVQYNNDILIEKIQPLIDKALSVMGNIGNTSKQSVITQLTKINLVLIGI